MAPNRPHQPSGLHVAVAVISAVMVLAGFSYATSRIVTVVSNPAEVSTAAQMVARDSNTARPPSLARPVSVAYRETAGIDRRWLLPVEVVLLDASGGDFVRVTAPQGRPLILRVGGLVAGDAIVIEALESPVIPIDSTGAACVPPLRRGAYPFMVVPMELDGMLFVE